MWKIEAAKGGVGTPQIPWKLIFKNLELATSPPFELIFHRLAILKTNLRIFLIAGDIILVVFDRLIVVDKVMGGDFDGQEVGGGGRFWLVGVESWCFVEKLFLSWLSWGRDYWGVVEEVAGLRKFSKFVFFHVVGLNFFELSEIVEGGFPLWLQLHIVLFFLSIFKLELKVGRMDAVQIKIKLKVFLNYQ